MTQQSADQQCGELALDDAKGKPFTTGNVNQMLWNRYTEKGEYVVLFDVPNVVGTKQERRCDAIAIGMWGSTGRLIHGFEIKTSRSDWLREVKDVSKADPFIEQCDRWWLVTGDMSISKPEEIPEAWGWMNATKTGLRIQRPAKPLPQSEVHIKRLWAFALIRRAAERGDINSPEFTAALQRHRDEVERRAEGRIKAETARAVPELERLRERVETFEKDSGMKLDDWRLGNVGKLARTLHAISGDGYRGFTAQLERQLLALESLVNGTRKTLAAVEAPASNGDDDD